MKKTLIRIGVGLVSILILASLDITSHIKNYFQMDRQENVGLRCEIVKTQKDNQDLYNLIIETETYFQSRTKDKKTLCFFTSRKDLVASYKTCVINSENYQTPKKTRSYRLDNFYPDRDHLVYLSYLVENKEESDTKFMKQYSDVGQLLTSLLKDSYSSFVLTLEVSKCSKNF